MAATARRLDRCARRLGGYTRPAFDGAHVVDVAYDQVRVATARGTAATDWVRLPQPVLFAELVDAARTLVAVCGHMLYVFDARTMQARYAPLELPATPQLLAVDHVGATPLLAFGHNGERGFEERIVTIARYRGHPRARRSRERADPAARVFARRSRHSGGRPTECGNASL